MIDIYTFLELYTTGDDVELYDCEREEVVFSGDPWDAMQEFGDYEVLSFDIESNGKLVINTETEED